MVKYGEYSQLTPDQEYVAMCCSFSYPLQLHAYSVHPLTCVQRVVLLGGALGRMFGGSPQFLFVFYRPDRRENVRS